MSIQSVCQGTFDFFEERPLVVATSDAQLSSDAGLLPLRQFEESLGLTRDFARVLDDPRDPDLIEHTFLDLTRMRVYGILADYVDQNDHDTLRHDPVFKLLADRAPDGPALASQPTLSRFDNSINIRSLFRLRDLLLTQFIASFATPPRHLTFDLDAVDDPVHGLQQLALFHGYFEQHQYFPAFITSADNEQVVLLALRFGTATASLGADDDLALLVERLRQVWPTVRISVRGDAGYGVPVMYAACERLGIEYLFGLATNSRLKDASDSLLSHAVADYERTGLPQRHFGAFWYQADSWDRTRWVVVKAEANAQGTNRRFVVTNRPGAQVLPEAAYDHYAQRGESEDRNKELKCGLQIDRTSDHRFVANYFRLYLHTLAYNLLTRFRQAMALPAEPPLPIETRPEVPSEAWTGAARQRWFRQRRQRDPLAAGQPCTWRSLLIKVAAEVVVSRRRIVIRLSASWPHLHYFQRVLQTLQTRPQPATS